MTTHRLIAEVELARPFAANGGHAFTATIPEELRGSFGSGALAVLLEDGKPLGPPDALHADIRERGGGAFSVWHSTLYFSSSDRTDCNENGRSYRLAAIDFTDGSAPYQHARQLFAGRDAELLHLIRLSDERNNSFFLNFFRYYNGINAVLKRNRIPFPEHAIELGTGARPYTALRFLLEGTRRFIANDVMQVTRTFESGFMQDLRALLELVAPDRCEPFDSMTSKDASGRIAVRGLEVHDEQPFEDIDLADSKFDLIFSTSVLEHVMKPREVVERMFALLRPGAHAFHSIDLRDHRDFSNPLAFLQMTGEEYAAVNTENRLRASDWLELFAGAGFEILECGYSAFKSASEQIHLHTPTPPAPWVDDKMRAGFRPPFDKKELVDLSALSIRILCRKVA